MPKKKSTRGRKSKKSQAPQHELPSGFWPQVAAVALIAFSLLLVVSWFGGGGDFLNWINDVCLRTIGYATYVVPVISIYVAIQVFRVEHNKLPGIMKFASIILIMWFSGLFGLFRPEGGASTGGVIGDTLNSIMTSLVNQPVAVFIYALLIVVTGLFVLRLSFQDVMDILRRKEVAEDADNVKVMRRAAASDEKVTPIADFKLNTGVPTLAQDEKIKPRISSLRGAVTSDKDAEEKAAMLAMSDPDWKFPSVDILEKKQNPADAGDIQKNARSIQDTLREFSIDVEMEGANVGPKVTQYTLKPPAGIKLSRITALESNIALDLAAKSIRMEAPIPGQRAVGIEVPNKKAADVRIRGILESAEWRKSREPLSFAIGRDISGSPVVGELNKMPHLLVAGQTNSGKSVMINTLLCSLLYRNSPSKMRVILVDPKQVEMSRYKDIPHLLTPIITEPEKTVSALKWAVNEMERRYTLLSEVGEVNIADYNKSLAKAKPAPAAQVEGEEDNEITPAEDGEMPYIVIVIDEMADLMMVASRDVETLVVRLAQKARAVGIHLVLATQSPRADVITGLIKANIPAKIAFTVGDQVESRIILGQAGAEKLLGQGDMLYKTATMGKPARVQGAWVMNEEVKKIADHLRMQSPPQYNDEIISQPVQLNNKGGVVMDYGNEGGDDMFKDACRVVIETRKASTSLLQRKLRIGYARAARIIEEMEEQGIIGAADGSRPRDVLITSLDDLDGSSADV